MPTRPRKTTSASRVFFATSDPFSGQLCEPDSRQHRSDGTAELRHDPSRPLDTRPSLHQRFEVHEVDGGSQLIRSPEFPGRFTPFTQALFASVWGFEYGRARLRGGSLVRMCVVGLASSALLHGLYDLLALSVSPFGSTRPLRSSSC